jgi:DNA polymerase III psi subunit
MSGILGNVCYQQQKEINWKPDKRLHVVEKCSQTTGVSFQLIIHNFNLHLNSVQYRAPRRIQKLPCKKTIIRQKLMGLNQVLENATMRVLMVYGKDLLQDPKNWMALNILPFGLQIR